MGDWESLTPKKFGRFNPQCKHAIANSWCYMVNTSIELSGQRFRILSNYFWICFSVKSCGRPHQRHRTVCSEVCILSYLHGGFRTLCRWFPGAGVGTRTWRAQRQRSACGLAYHRRTSHRRRLDRLVRHSDSTSWRLRCWSTSDRLCSVQPSTKFVQKLIRAARLLGTIVRCNNPACSQTHSFYATKIRKRFFCWIKMRTTVPFAKTHLLDQVFELWKISWGIEILDGRSQTKVLM